MIPPGQVFAVGLGVVACFSSPASIVALPAAMVKGEITIDERSGQYEALLKRFLAVHGAAA